MAVLKCKMCGAQLNIDETQRLIKCEYCDSVQTLPKFDDELKIKMFERANELRARCEFDQAATLFQSIVMQFPEEAEAYWGLVLCKYGIEYVDDSKTHKKIPTCHRTQPKSILNDSDYLSACEHSGATKWIYEKEAEEINRIQKKILDIVQTEKPYDVFICYKETDDDTKARTEDSSTAQDIYTELIKEGYRVFYSRISLRDKAGSEYEPYIYAALSTAKIMLVIGSKTEYFNAVWLKNEWSRYLSMISDGNKNLIPCFEKISAGDLPKELQIFEALDMSSKLFFTDLLKNIKRILPKQTSQQNQNAHQTIPKVNVKDNSFPPKTIFKESEFEENSKSPAPPPRRTPAASQKAPVNKNTINYFKRQGVEDLEKHKLDEYNKQEFKGKIRDFISWLFFSAVLIFLIWYLCTNGFE